MKKIVLFAAAIATVVAAACSSTDTNAPSNELALTLASAYANVPAGYSELSSSYVGDAGAAFQPDFGRRGGPGGHGGRGDGPGFGLGFMGGGLFGGFHGDGFGRWNFPTDTSCHYASATGIVTCGPTTRNGITATRTIKFQNATGTAQSAFDTLTTNTVTTTSNVSGAITRRDSGNSTIASSSNQVVTGLAPTSAQRTVNSTSAGTETTTGTSTQGAFTAKRTSGDTVKAVVIPRATTTNTRPYPTAGQIIRSMSATVAITGQTPTTSTRREVVTYDGTATAKVVITLNGTTQNCTLPLPHGRLTCQ
jgi:hypothetical protein